MSTMTPRSLSVMETESWERSGREARPGWDSATGQEWAGGRERRAGWPRDPEHLQFLS